ncbi:MAG TPA: hypothetical protein VK668_01840 [Mucilaginibacter sp.]|nr:hypothetical protein [Mucilaginibacter sp.]
MEELKHKIVHWDTGLVQLTIKYRDRFDGRIEDYFDLYFDPNRLVFGKRRLDGTVRDELIALHNSIFD